jgi:chromosome segregation ATPase
MMPADRDPGAEAQAEVPEGAEGPGGRSRGTDQNPKADQAADGDLQRVQRGLRNVAFALERDRAAVQETIEGMRGQVASLSERVERAESGELRDIKRELRELTDRLEQDRALIETRVGELRERLEATARADDLAALRRRVNKANASLATLREQASRPRRFGRRRRRAPTAEGTAREHPGA